MALNRRRKSSARRNIFGGLADGLREFVPAISGGATKVSEALQSTSGVNIPANAAPLTGLLGAANTGQITSQTVDVGPQAIAKFEQEEKAKRNAEIKKRLDSVNQQEKELTNRLAAYQAEFANDDGSNTNAFYLAGAELKKIQAQKPQVLQEALQVGVDLRPYYGETYADAVKFKQDLGQYTGKDESMIIPANPVGYGGQFKFDPNFGSTFYRDLATQSGKALGLSDEQILQKGTEYFKDKFASGPKTAGVIGFTDFGTGLIDSFATTAGVPAERLGELKGTALKPLYDASNQVFQGLNGAARIESQSSGFFKGIGQDIAKLGPIGTIALTAALGPAGAGLSTALAAGSAAALPGLLQGDFEGAIKSGLLSGGLAGIGAGALKDVGANLSNSLGGGSLGNIAGGAAQGAIRGGVGSLLSGGDLGQGLLSGGLFGAGSSAAGEAVGAAKNALSTKPDIYSLTDGKTPGIGLKAPQAGEGLSLFAPTGEGLLGVDFGDPNNFGPSFDLPNGLLDFRPSVPQIGTIGDITIPRTIGFNPNVRNSDMGLDLTDKQTVPGQLGSGITFDVPGGTIGQGGFIPTGQITLGNPNSFINGGTQGSSSGFDVSKLLKGLLGAGTAAAVGNALTRSPQQQQTQQALPVQRFSMNPQQFNYGGDAAKYGETDIGNFQFYKPNLGLLG